MTETSERTFVMIKPHHVDLAYTILRELDHYARREKTARVESVPREVIEDHYSVHRGKPFYNMLVESFVGKEVVIAVYEGNGAVKRIMRVTGHTDPSKAEKNSIRGKYSDDSRAKADAENRVIRNVIHRSDCPEEAEREIIVWEKYLFPV